MESTLKSRVFFVEGCKGGVGKSLMCSALMDWLLESKEKTLLIETDTTNPELWSTYKDITQVHTLDLDAPEGWIALVNSIEQHPDSHVVVNTAARNLKGSASYGYTLYESLEELNRSLITYFVINHEVESVHLLKSYWQSLPSPSSHVQLNVVKNEFFSPTYDLFDRSKVRVEIENHGGSVLRLPLLARDVAELLRNQKLPISVAMQPAHMGMGNRTVLKRWRALVRNEIERSLVEHPRAGGIEGRALSLTA
jgi:hypothetical protein